MSRKKFDIIPGHNFKNGKLEQDNVFVGGELKDTASLLGLKVGKAKANTLVVADEAINFVSDQYGFLKNEDFFGQIEQRLSDAGIGYNRRSVNRANRSFRVDYILNDDSFHVDVKGSKDKIKPMISAQSSYDGSTLTGAHLGFFREICSNGLHTAKTQLQFKLRRRANIVDVYIDKIEETVANFMSNEFYSLHKKFEVMSESPLSSVDEFVKYTLGATGLFKYEKSEKNPDEASAGARFLIDTINAEATELNIKPNLWLGYNAFNEYIHTMTNNAFMVQDRADKKIFNAILEQVN